MGRVEDGTMVFMDSPCGAGQEEVQKNAEDIAVSLGEGLDYLS